MPTAHPIRILMLLQNSNYSDDGRVIREATALREAGYSVSVIGPRGKHERFFTTFEHGVVAFQYPAWLFGSGYLRYMCEYAYSLTITFLLSVYVLATRGFDVIHAHNPPDLFVAVAVFYKLIDKRFIFDHHDLAPEMFQVRFGGKRSLIHRLLVACERMSCRQADHIVAANESHKRILGARAGVSSARVTVVRNGPEERHFAAIESHSSLRGLHKTIIGYVGEMGPLDGIELLLGALKSLRDDLKRDDWLCVLVGDGESFESIKREASQLGLADFTRFIGRVSLAEVIPYIEAMDICTIPDPKNAYTTHCTLVKTMEYMARGKPIVAFDLAETRFNADDSAIYVPDNDIRKFARAVAELMDDSARRETMGRIGRARARQLAWRSSIPPLLSVYARVTGRPPDNPTKGPEETRSIITTGVNTPPTASCSHRGV